MATDAQRAWSNHGLHMPNRFWSPPKLTTVQRAEICQRLADGEKPKALALEYGVSANTIRRCR
jgi:DNA-binding NarL/FixJ family response regulator